MKTYLSLNDAITEIYGEGRKITARTPVVGGDINEAYLLKLDDGRHLFLKSNRPDFLPCFRAEAEGLTAIKETGAIGVPHVLGLVQEKNHSFLLLEYIESGKKISRFWETFARELAGMHGAGTDSFTGYGFFHDNWIGATRQINQPHESWIAFFRDCRLKPQVNMAQSYFTTADKRKIDDLLGRLDSYLTEPDKPALIHGDLWAGNMITGNDGKGWLIDPAVYYGHPEADIAMTELFGGFSYQFYGAYRETGHMDYGYEDRRDLYNLYHLLNHLNMFGGGYLGSVRAILDRYGR